MDESDIHEGIDIRVEPRRAIWSIVGFWLLYFAISSARSWIWPPSLQLTLGTARLVVCVACALATGGMYLVLRWANVTRPGRAIVLAIALSIPCSILYGFTNAYMFHVWAPQAGHYQTPAAAFAVGATSQDYFTVADAIDGALTGFFSLRPGAGCTFFLAHAARSAALQARALRLSAAAQTAELRALRYQVNPHFLFNTLNSLSSLVLDGQRVEAERMIVGLSTFLRASLSGDPTEDVPLVDELALQRLYLDIEQARFGDRLRIGIDVSASAEGACVPGLILQPLVENAIKHAVARVNSAVTITIRATTTDRRLNICVENDGVGKDASIQPGAGIGLRNVRDRLAARFGPSATMETVAHAPGGFRVTLSMPLVQCDV